MVIGALKGCVFSGVVSISLVISESDIIVYRGVGHPLPLGNSLDLTPMGQTMT